MLNPDAPFFFFFWLTGFRLMVNRVIFDIRWVVDKACIYTMKGQMIGVQCQLMICRGHIRASKGTFQIFLWLTVLCKN